MEQIDYLVIGHVSNDRTPDGLHLGGTVSYAGRAAQAQGCRTAVFTSAATDFNGQQTWPDIVTYCVPADATTTFTNRYTANGREQTLHARAERLLTAAVPMEWRRAGIVHLAPIADEVDPDMIYAFSNSLIGLTPQGWMRQWDENGRVSTKEWLRAQEILPLAAAVIVSEEDFPDKAMLAQYRQWSRLLVLTQGAQGCTLFFDDEIRQIPAPQVKEVETTGAGDIFAAAFFIRLYQTGGNPWEAARYANEIAAQSVTQVGLEAKIKQAAQQQGSKVAK